jgi:hypothetical protein
VDLTSRFEQDARPGWEPVAAEQTPHPVARSARRTKISGKYLVAFAEDELLGHVE